jgi:hypothetical protein
MTQTLAIVPKSTPTLLDPKESAKRYAAYLTAASDCVDVSSYPMKVFNADSDSVRIIEDLRYGFPTWAKASNIRVDLKDDKYGAFLDGLTNRLMPDLHRVLGSSFYPATNYEKAKHKFFKDSHGVLLANTYVPFQPQRPSVSGTPPILAEYLSRVLSNPQDYKMVLQWCADIIQNPSRRPMWSIVVTGEQGSGKSSLFRLVTLALGKRYTWERGDYGPVFKQFSEILPNNLLVSFDDAPPRANTYQKLKQVITCTSAQVELKGVQKLVHRDIHARIMVCSNSPRPLIIEKGDRRLYCVEPSKHKISDVETAEFFVTFNDWMESPEAPAILYHFFMDFDLSDFLPGSTIRTATHDAMVGLSTLVLDDLLLAYITPGEPDSDSEKPMFHNSTLIAYLASSGLKAPDVDLLKGKFAALGYEHKRRTVTIEAATFTTKAITENILVWQPSLPQGKRSRGLTDDEHKEITQAHTISF